MIPQQYPTMGYCVATKNGFRLHCLIEISATMEYSISALSITVDTIVTYLLNLWNVTSVTEYLIVYNSNEFKFEFKYIFFKVFMKTCIMFVLTK